jgi:XTP/dITP diphosphohydrolase
VEIVYASSNSGKVDEMKRLAEMMSLRIVGLSETLECCHVIPEVADSYEGNARAKAQTHAVSIGRPCLADDSGIEILQLGGLPGVYTNRFGLTRVMELMKNPSPAIFVCCMCYAEPLGRCVSVTQKIQGVFSVCDKRLDRNYPLPYSHFFYPELSAAPLSELIAMDPLASHRARALRALLISLGVYQE